jgi:FixJ family two-component response regulator
VDQLPLVSIIDADVSVRRALARLISSMGFRAHTYGSAEKFLASADRDHARCLILDVLLPGMDGLELQRLLSVLNVPIPVIFMTGGTAEVRQRAMNAGAVGVLDKPIRVQDLLAGVASALEVRQT